MGAKTSTTTKHTKLSVDPELKVYLELISICQIETKEAMKALSEENLNDSILCTIYAKMNSTESNFLAKSQDFHDKITTDIKSLNEDTHSSIADMRGNLQALIKKVDSHFSNTSANLSSCMDRSDEFDLEINKLANSFASTQTELSIFRSMFLLPITNQVHHQIMGL